MIGNDLVKTIRKFGIERKVCIDVIPLFWSSDVDRIVSQLGWMVGDGASANDVAVRQVCKELDPKKEYLKPKEVRILYVSFFCTQTPVLLTNC